MPVDPLGSKKTVLHEPQNKNLFDDKATSLKKRKAELEQSPRKLTSAEQAELKEINRQLDKINQEQRNKDFYSKKIF